jgi:two-component system CheB/CheR fusion protein
MTKKLQKHDNQRQLTLKDNRIAVLKKQLEYYKEITETIREPFIILTDKLYVVTANPAFYKMFKVLRKDTEGHRMYELGTNQWDAPELRELLEHILPTKKVLNDYEITLDFPKLGKKTMLLNARQVDSKQLILLAVEDVTEQKTFRLSMDKMTANLTMQRDKLQGLNDAKDEFISLASHQLRTPATAVKQYVGMLSQGYAGAVSEEQVAMLDIAYRSNERQLEIIEDLLRVAKVDAGKVYLQKSSYDIVEQIESVISGQTILFKSRDQTVVFNKPQERINIYSDHKLISMVLDNILDNAGKYSQNGAVITIMLKQKNGYTSVSIHDDGVGISKKDMDKLFKKFVRIDNSLSTSVKGTGLGLYWAKKILDLHGGSIEVTSTPKKGTTFTVITPTDDKRPAALLAAM